MDATEIRIEVQKKNGNAALATFTVLTDAVDFITTHAANLSGDKTNADDTADA